ncbi:Ger(x)C family spore germination protein [Paenibacillus sanguinis]|uniref:Ger(x)C family spore germination protein n=1 Tax=Paenibacillus sanguinis TaxID=225906 RepID=UPI00037BB0CF|nr:Ger(x)C family spore germination protein [Paenibacillus sanguinis]
MAKKKLILILCWIFVMSTLSGCWHQNELTDLAIVSATGVNRKDKQWEVTFQLLTPANASANASGGPGSGPPISVLSTQGKTLRKALSNNEMENTRQLHLGNNRVLIIGEAAAKYGLNSLIDAYLRNPQARETVDLFVSKQDPKLLVSQLMYLEKNTGEGIHKLIDKENKATSILPKINMFDLANQLAGPSKCAIMPELMISGTPETGSTQALETTISASKLKLGGLAVLKAGKLAGWLNQDEALGVSFIRNRVNQAVIPFSFPEADSEDENKATFEISANATKLDIRMEQQKIKVDATIKAAGMITDTEFKLDASDPELIKELEQVIKKELLGIISQGWSGVHELKADIVGFAEMFRRKNPKEWKQVENQWENVFADIEFKPTVQITIERVGLTNQSYQEFAE